MNNDTNYDDDYYLHINQKQSFNSTASGSMSMNMKITINMKLNKTSLMTNTSVDFIIFSLLFNLNVTFFSFELQYQ